MCIKKRSTTLKYNEIPYNVFYTTYKKKFEPPYIMRKCLIIFNDNTYKKKVRILLHYKIIP